MSSLSPIRVWVVESEWPRGPVDVVCGRIAIRLQDSCLPHCQGGGSQVAEGAQVQVSRVAGAKYGPNNWKKRYFSNCSTTIYIFLSTIGPEPSR